ncbi:MAG: hypothetical protein HFK10_06040 [Clostridia bacterium]|jgi:hypothetical protein|nr:hypothetical protein [Clostridia bacterium]
MKKKLFFAGFHTKGFYFYYIPFISVFFMVFLLVIIYDVINTGNISLFVFYLISDIIAIIIHILIMGLIPEYYIFDFDRNIIKVKSLLMTRKIVNINSIKGIYWQEMSHRTLITKKYFYIVDDGSSTSIKIPFSNHLDLMRIPIDKKSKAIIASIWPHEIKESHFPERR